MSVQLRARAAMAELAIGMFAFNPRQPRGADGRWIKTGGGQTAPRPGAAAPSLSARVAGLRRSLESGEVSRRPLGDGMMGAVDLVETSDGAQIVHKRSHGEVEASNGEPLDPQTQMDAEQLSSVVAHALGVRAPAVHRTSDDAVAMELVPGKTGAELFPGRSELPEEMLASSQAIQIGLLDVLSNNNDRHGGNWMVDPDGDLHAIDHGLTFGGPDEYGPDSAATGPFATGHFVTHEGGFKENPLTSGDVERLRSRLERLRPEFDALGRQQWFDDMLERLDMVSEYAGGSVDVFPSGGSS